AVLQHADLRAVAGLAHDHDALDGLAARQELGLGDERRAAAAGVPALAAALLLGLQAGRAAHALHVVVRAAEGGLGAVALLADAGVAGLADLDDGVRRVVRAELDGVGAGAAATATTAARGTGALV